MSFDVDLHRHTIRLPGRLRGDRPLDMSVVDAGPHSGVRDGAPTMVFIHGFGGRAAYWEHQLEQFHDDYRVIALDLRGHGYTDAPDEEDGARYDVPELVADIEAALDVLGVPERFILVCHSFGGALSSYFIHKHPQRVSALVIIASAVTFRLRLAGRMLLRVPPAILTWVRRMLPLVGVDAARLYPPAHVVYLQNRNALVGWDGTAFLRAVRAPTLVILGQRDILFSDASYKEVARLVPGAEQVVIPVSAHQVMVERPDAVNRAILRFLQSQGDPAAVAEFKARQKALRRAARRTLEAERPWLKFYDARTPYRIRPPAAPLPRLLEATARRFARTAAIDYAGGTLDWRSLDRLANRFAQGMLALGIRPGDRIVLALPNIPHFLIAYFGVQKAGGVAVLSEDGASVDLLLDRIAAHDAAMLVATSDRLDALRDPLATDVRARSARHVVLAAPIDYLGWKERLRFALFRHVQQGYWLPWFRLGERQRRHERRFLRFGQVLGMGAPLPPAVPVGLDDIAVIAHTFGATGPAKAVPLTHRQLASNALQLRHWLPEARPGDERFLAQQPFWTAYGLSGLVHLGMYLGATLCLVPEQDIPLLLRTVRRVRPTYFPTTPRVVRQLAHAPGVRRYGLASIRICAVSGSPLAQEVREEFEKITRGRLIEAYGLTEATAAVAAMPLSARRPSGVVGLPLPDTEVRIVDLDTGGDAAPDALGELLVRGPQVYTASAEVPGPTSSAGRPHDGWLRTGDVASMDEDGFLTIIDRKANMVMRDGVRVFPRQIEEVLFEHPAVADVQVRRIAEGDAAVRLEARVLLHRNMDIPVEELFGYCAKRLQPGALPDSIALEQEQAPRMA